MTPISLAFFLLIFGLSSSVVFAGGKKGENISISFHLEGDQEDNPKMIFAHEIGLKQRIFRRMPEISSRDLVAFSPFPAADQASYGALIRLNGAAASRLTAITQTSIGRWFVCRAFGKIIDGVMIDEPINDGVLVIWKGLSLEQIHLMDKDLKRIGEKSKIK